MSQAPPPLNPWTQAGMAMTIPMMMLAGPLVGYGIGWLLRRWLGWGAWIEMGMLVLGFVAGVRESVAIIRRMGQ